MNRKTKHVTDAEFKSLAVLRTIVAPCGCEIGFNDSTQCFDVVIYCVDDLDNCRCHHTLNDLDLVGEHDGRNINVTHKQASAVVSVGYAMAARDRAAKRRARRAALASKRRRS